MLFRDKQLRCIPVVTKNGEKIGKLAGFVIDGATHSVSQYVVTKSRLLSAILPKEFLIDQSQVISIDTEKMVVQDGTVAVLAAEAIVVTKQAQAQ